MMRERDERLWNAGLHVVGELVNDGHEAYLVGGCVRDRMLGRPLHDIDITTSALPEQVMKLFSRTIPTGLQHGTVTVLEGGLVFEVTTFRQEFGYSDARRPDEVAFVLDVREDLARRDFTFNAMAVGLDHEVIDPFGGRNDLQARIVRCVGHANERFSEDALRILRAIRFGAELGFELAAEVWEGITLQRQRLSQVAMERVGTEWDKMMSGANPELAYHWLQQSGLLAHLKEQLPQQLVDYQMSDRAITHKITSIVDVDLRWAALLTSAGLSVEQSLQFGRSLRFSSRRGQRIASVVGFSQMLQFDANHERCTFAREHWIDAVLAYGISTAEDWHKIYRTETSTEYEWLASIPITVVSQLAIKGNELSKQLNKPPGPWIAQILQHLLAEVAHGRLANERDALLRIASTWD
ncbi:MAG: CCA tRNA nucleotidyltransferase [Candidatus Cohnella colombiensis]|uniref:CCA tRNA nucleotidyltransferase n=1 Tax=Candidatus Cohnella colombiensis TaxID=3121368 RepID=A0AA95F2M7_9BACL|nr:MAG: CCA tRNA nucleotidyltransferase [Cohnella sp.]